MRALLVLACFAISLPIHGEERLRLVDQHLSRPAPWDRIAPAVAAGRTGEATKALDKLATGKRTAALDRARVRLVQGVLAYREGRYQQALDALAGLAPWAELGPVLAYYEGAARFHLGQVEASIEPLSRVVDSGLSGYALDLLLEALAQVGRWAELEATLARQVEGPLKGTAEALYFGARLAEGHGRADEARAGFARVPLEFPGSEWAFPALDRLPAAARPTGIDADLRAYQAAARDLASGRPRTALKALGKLAARLPDDHPLACRALSDLVQAALRARDPDAAMPHLGQRHPACVTHPAWADALFSGGRLLWRAGDREGARRLYARLRELFPDHSYRDDALLYQALTRQEEGDEAGFVADLEEAIRRYPDDDRHGEIRWWLAWHLVKKGTRGAALAALAQGYQATQDPAFAYWDARLLEKRKATRAQALERYRALLEAHPLDYYATLAYSRLATHVGAEAARKQALDAGMASARKARALVPRDELARALAAPRAQRAQELWRLGLDDLAFDEHPGPDASAVDWWLAAQWRATAGRPDLAHQIVRRRVDGHRARYPLRSFRAYWDLGWPRAFHAQAAKAATRVGLAPAFVEAIVREESGFVPDIVSHADAHGLMQLLPSTARLVAKENGLARPSVADLHRPDTNLLLGSLYLDFLVRRFGSPMLAAGAYNAGHGRMGKWLDEQPARFDLDAFVEDIPYREARHYVKRVIESFGVHRFLESDGARWLQLDLAYDKARRYDPKARIQKWAPKKASPKKSTSPKKSASPKKANPKAKKR